MFPYITIFGRDIATYAIAALIGALLCGALIYRDAVKQKLDEVEAIILLLVACVGVFLGMHLLYGFTMLPYVGEFYRQMPPFSSFENFIGFFGSIFGGSVFYGGLLGGLAAGYLYVRRKKLPTAEYSDLVAVYIPLFHMFGRIGCFLGGCCYGIPSSFGFTFENSPLPSANGVCRFPVQLLEAFCLLLLFLALLFLRRKGRCRGRIMETYLISYAVLRFCLEFLRGDTYRGFLLGLSTSQIISILIFAACLVRLLLRRKKTPQAA